MTEVVLVAEPLPACAALKAAVRARLRAVYRPSTTPTLHVANNARLHVNSVNKVNKCLAPRFVAYSVYHPTDDHASHRRRFPETPARDPKTSLHPEALS